MRVHYPKKGVFVDTVSKIKTYTTLYTEVVLVDNVVDKVE